MRDLIAPFKKFFHLAAQWAARAGFKNNLVASLLRWGASQAVLQERRAKKPEVYPLRYTEDFFAKATAGAAPRSASAAEGIFETSSIIPDSGSVWRYRVAILGLSLVIHLGFYYLASHGTWRIFGREVYSETFDSLALSLLEMRSDVDRNAIGSEAFTVDGRVFTYFGPFPALLRIAVRRIFFDGYGRLGRLSTFTAAIFASVAWFWICTMMTNASNLPRRMRQHIILWSTAGGTLSFPLPFLVAAGSVWHEAMAWGYCWGLWAMFLFLRILNSKLLTSPLTYGALSFSVGCALLSRTTFALPGVLLMGFLGLKLITMQSPSLHWDRRLSALLLLSLPLALLGEIQLWYNLDRFGGVLTFIDNSAHMNDPSAFGGSWNAYRIPSAVWNYFGIRSDCFSETFPYFRFATVKFLDETIFFLPYREGTISLLLLCPWLIVTAMLALIHMAKRGMWLPIAFTATFLTQWGVVLPFFFLTMRYAVDLLPFFLFAYAMHLGRLTTEHRVALFGFRFVIPVLVTFSVFVSIVTTLDWCAANSNWMMLDGKFKTSIREIFSAVASIARL